MGGRVFSSGANPLNTPRMPRDVYLEAKQKCFQALQKLFEVVESPIDGPGKEDFGDIDILVFGSKGDGDSLTREGALEVIKEALGATRFIRESSTGVAAHFAIPWPAKHAKVKQQNGDSHRKVPGTESRGIRLTQDEEWHIQVDVTVCTSRDKLQWILFKHAHGDLWNVLGTIIRPYGLTVDQDALWLRVPEIEKLNRNRAKIMLTTEHAHILEFLGISEAQFWGGCFDSMHDLFEYAAQCRMFWVRPEEPDAPPILNQTKDDVGTTENKGKLKSNDRRRMEQRPLFRKWIEEFVPACREKGRFLEQKKTRKEVTQEAFERFGVKKEYETRRRDFLVEQQRLVIWTEEIKTAVPHPQSTDQVKNHYRSCQIKALKSIILENDRSFGVVPEKSLVDEDGFFIMEDVVDFINRKKESVGKAAWRRQQNKYEESLLGKSLETGTQNGEVK